MNTEQVTVTKEQFHDFQRLQKSGLYNMLDPEVRNVLEISKEQHHYIVNHYAELKKEHGGI